MNRWLASALILNIIVLVPVTMSLIRRSDWTIEAYGNLSPSRQVLLCVYLSILVWSVLILVLRSNTAALALLSVQATYKILSVLITRDLSNPVIVSNLMIAVFEIIAISAACSTSEKIFN